MKAGNQSNLNSSETSINALEATGFHIIPSIYAFLPLDFVQRSLAKCDAPRESAHVKVESGLIGLIAN